MPEQVKDTKASEQPNKVQEPSKPTQSKAEPPKPEPPKPDTNKVPIIGTTATTPIKPPEAEPVDEPKPPTPKLDLVAFQFDRDTTIVAEVLTRYDDNTIDLIAHTDHTGHFKTNISTPASEKVYEAVRPGSRFEAGTYFPLPEGYSGSAGEQIVDHSIFKNKKVVKTVVSQREI